MQENSGGEKCVKGIEEEDHHTLDPLCYASNNMYSDSSGNSSLFPSLFSII